jgi:lysozyme
MNELPHLSPRGVAVIKKWEGFYPKAYKDPVGVLTIGYGSITNRSLGIKVVPGMKIDEATALDYLSREVIQFEDRLAKLLKVQVTQGQWDALCVWGYNVGIGNVERSTLLKVLNQGKYKAVPVQLMRWTMARSRDTGEWIKLRGLVNRRNDEVRLWNGEAIKEVPDENHIVVQVPKGDMKAQVNDKALEQTVTKSHTGKTVIAQIVGGIVTGVTSGDPTVLFLCSLVVAAGLYIGYRKWKDLREFVQ